MPLLYIDLSSGREPSVRRQIADTLHDAVVAGLGVPADDRFQVLTVHEPGELIFSKNYMGAEREDPIFVQIILYGVHTDDEKEAMFEAMGRNVERLGVKKDELFVAITENGTRTRRDWFAGVHGIAMPDPTPGH